jgi:hypothetical protein
MERIDKRSVIAGVVAEEETEGGKTRGGDTRARENPARGQPLFLKINFVSCIRNRGGRWRKSVDVETVSTHFKAKPALPE